MQSCINSNHDTISSNHGWGQYSNVFAADTNTNLTPAVETSRPTFGVYLLVLHDCMQCSTPTSILALHLLVCNLACKVCVPSMQVAEADGACLASSGLLVITVSSPQQVLHILEIRQLQFKSRLSCCIYIHEVNASQLTIADSAMVPSSSAASPSAVSCTIHILSLLHMVAAHGCVYMS